MPPEETDLKIDTYPELEEELNKEITEKMVPVEETLEPLKTN